MSKFNFESLTLGEVATIEDLADTGIAALSKETPQGKFLAALYMVAKRRSGEPTFTFNQALNVPMLEAQTFLGFDEADAEDAEGEAQDAPVDEAAERAQTRAEIKAQTIVHAGVSPTEYEQLTVAEHNAIRDELARRQHA